MGAGKRTGRNSVGCTIDVDRLLKNRPGDPMLDWFRVYQNQMADIAALRPRIRIWVSPSLTEPPTSGST